MHIFTVNFFYVVNDSYLESIIKILINKFKHRLFIVYICMVILFITLSYRLYILYENKSHLILIKL